MHHEKLEKDSETENEEKQTKKKCVVLTVEVRAKLDEFIEEVNRNRRTFRLE